MVPTILTMSDVPAYDALRRGHTVLAPDPFEGVDEQTRPWVVVNNEDHPFDGEQYVVMALTFGMLLALTSTLLFAIAEDRFSPSPEPA